MPGLGDAFSKAMEGSRRDLDDLVRRAAEGEPPTSEIKVPEMPPPPSGRVLAAPAEAAGRTKPVSAEERESLMGNPGDAPKAPAPSAERAPEPAPRAARRAVEPPQPVAPSTPPPSAELIAPFAPSGVIRRSLQKQPDNDTTMLGRTAPLRRPLQDELSRSRRISGLLDGAIYRDPGLVQGVVGASRLVMTGKAGNPAALAICSVEPDAGATMVAVALALELAQRPGLRVLMIDGNFRSPGLDKVIGPTEAPDLANVLAGDAKLGDALICLEGRNLAFLPVVNAAVTAGQLSAANLLLDKQAPARLFEQCHDIFDAVIIDVGSVTGWAGASRLAAAAGTAVMVVRAGCTSQNLARKARRTVQSSGTRVAGSILTCAKSALDGG